MQAYSPTKRIWKRMLEYGAIWGTLFGSALSVILCLVSIDYANMPHWLFIVTGLMFVMVMGCFSGALIGIFVGLFAGLAMSWITKGYGHPQNATEYRVAIGLVAGLIAVLMFLPLLLLVPFIDDALFRNNYLTAILGSIGVVIYASQRVATKYLAEINHTVIV